jgi:hypothetical protein
MDEQVKGKGKRHRIQFAERVGVVDKQIARHMGEIARLTQKRDLMFAQRNAEIESMQAEVEEVQS